MRTRRFEAVRGRVKIALWRGGFDMGEEERRCCMVWVWEGYLVEVYRCQGVGHTEVYVGKTYT